MLRRVLGSRLLLAALLPVLLALGIWLGAHPQLLPGPIADALAGPPERRAAIQALDAIDDRYYRRVDRERLADAAIGGAVEELDDAFSAYFSPREYSTFQQALNNEFSGIGTAITAVERGLRIELVYAGSPARRAGLRQGDVITHADGRRLAGRPAEAATALVKGRAGTVVTLRVRRGERTFQRRVRRERITVPVVASRIASAAGERAGYIRLATFGPRTAHGEVAAAIRRLRRRGAKGFVLDLRANGGGLVTEAQLVASMFLERGPIVTTRGRAVPERTLSAVGEAIAGDLPTVVLVDRGTASAAEIVAGALQDRGRARLVGRQTFGKGVFQEILPLGNGGALDITVGQYFLPSGRNLGGRGTRRGDGLKPDVRADDDPDTEVDEALKRALRVLAREL